MQMPTQLSQTVTLARRKRAKRQWLLAISQDGAVMKQTSPLPSRMSCRAILYYRAVVIYPNSLE